MGLRDRILQYIEYKGVEKSTFERNCGLSNDAVNKMGDNTRSTTLDKISNAYPDLNMLWLRTGYGEMILPAGLTKEMNSIKAMFSDELEKAQEQNEKADFLLKTTSIIPLLPVAAQAGRLGDFITSVMEYDCEKVVSPMAGIDFAITVAGDSMTPSYPPGTQLFVKRIDEKAFIDWGKVYVLDTLNGVVIKKIMPGSDETKIKCVSINPEYPAFEVRFEDVFGMYIVKLSMSVQ